MTRPEPEPVVAAAARGTDPLESHAAAASVNVRRNQKTVLAAFDAYGPMTDQALVTRLDGLMSPSGARTRRRELADMGLVEDTGLRVKLASGRQAAVWQMTGER
jgi:hypothetical protein